ncbi:hypothetical protein U9M48_009506 [Paspalum notatum var. saurae]|uniref:Uncharacterized protein n=1 Tax=Paspalum notatum var. saurae TaxID=547442 RepID=A0AAQ3WF86_PASNO
MAAADEEIVVQQQPQEQCGGSESSRKDYADPPRPQPVLVALELRRWSLYRAAIAEFVATLLFLYVTVTTVIGYKRQSELDASGCCGVGVLGIAWAFGGMIFLLVYCTAGMSGLSNDKHCLYIVDSTDATLVSQGEWAIHSPDSFARLRGGANGRGAGLAAEVVGTLVLVYTVLSATDAKRSARDSHIPVTNTSY